MIYSDSYIGYDFGDDRTLRAGQEIKWRNGERGLAISRMMRIYFQKNNVITEGQTKVVLMGFNSFLFK